MRLRTVFLLCFAVACLPALGWSAWIAITAQSEWANAASAVRKAEAMGDALQLIEALSLERGVLQERALSDGSVTADPAEMAAANDALLDRAQRSMRRAELPDDAVTQSRDILVKLRRQVAEAVVRPVTERDPGLAPAIMAQLYERLGAVQGAVARAEREAALADARVGALVAVGSLAVEMRAAAGWRSSNLTGWFGGRVLTPGQLDEAMYMTGQVQHAWDRLQRQVLLVGEPPRLAAAIAATRDGFFRLAEPRYREYLGIARAGGARPNPCSRGGGGPSKHSGGHCSRATQRSPRRWTTEPRWHSRRRCISPSPVPRARPLRAGGRRSAGADAPSGAAGAAPDGGGHPPRER